MSATPPTGTPLPIDVFSDVVCPWCFIGKRRLERAIALEPDIPVKVRWRPYFLNPWVPPEGMDRADYLAAKFGSVERYTENARRMVDIARIEGLPYALDAIARQPNTLDCHRLIRWAGEAGDAGRMKQRLMELYFSEGADLSDPAVLVQAAVDCGMDGESIAASLAGDADVDAVVAEADAAQEAGITGVPCFVFGGVLAVSGAQTPDYLAGAIQRAAPEFSRRIAAGLIADADALPF